MNEPAVIGLMGDRYHGSNWWRTIMPFSYLARKGLNVVYAENTDPGSGLEVAAYDLVILFGLAFPSAQQAKRYVRACHQQGKSVLFDTDDDLAGIGYMAEAWDEEHKAQYAIDRPRILKTMQACDGVITSRGHLAARVSVLTPKPIAVVPNLLDFEWWGAVQGAGKRLADPDQITIGWIGARRNERDLALMAEAWARVAVERPNVQFVIGGYQSATLVSAVGADRVFALPWCSLDYYPLHYLNLDIGCCPLERTAFNLSKSPIKAIECAASRVPVVASPTVYADAFEGARFADSGHEWAEHLLALVDSEDLRRQEGDRLFAEAYERHSLQLNWLRILAGWQSLLDQCAAARERRVLTHQDALPIL